MGEGNRQTVTGVVINHVFDLSRQERRRLRAMAHQRSRQDSGGDTHEQQRAKLEGKIAYVSILNPQQAVPFVKH